MADQIPDAPTGGGVETATLQVPMQSTQVSPDRYGAKLGEGLYEAAGSLDRIQARADALAAQEAETQFSKEITDRLDGSVDADGNATPGFTELKGHAAIEASAELTRSIEDRRKEIAGNLTNKRQSDLFLGRTSGEIVSANRSIENHVKEQVVFLKQQAVKTQLETAEKRAAALAVSPSGTTDIIGAAREVDKMRPWLELAAEDQGLRGADADRFVKAGQSAVAVTVLERLLEDPTKGGRGHAAEARMFLEAHRDILDEKQIYPLKERLAAATLRDDGQAAADRIWALSGGDATTALGMARAIGNVNFPVPPGGTPHDLTKPILRSADGKTWMTEKTIAETDPTTGKVVTVPSIVNGKEYTREQAWQMYLDGKNPAVGVHDTPEEANAYGQQRHNEEQILRAIPQGGAELRAEVEHRLMQRISDDARVREAVDSPRVARLETLVLRGQDINRLRLTQDFLALSDEGKRHVEATAKAEKRADTAEQNRIDDELFWRYKGLPLGNGPAGLTRVTVDPNSPLFTGGSSKLRDRIRAEQQQAQAEWNKDQGLGRDQFITTAREIADQMSWTGSEGPGSFTRRAKFIRAMESEYDAWLKKPDNAGAKAVPPQDAAEMAANAMRYGDYGHWYSSNVYAWEANAAGESADFRQTGDQKGLEAVQRVFEARPLPVGVARPSPAAAAAPPPAPAPPPKRRAPGTRVQGSEIGQPGGVWEVQPNGKFKRVG